MPVLKNNNNEIKFYKNQLSVTSGNITDLENKFLHSNLSATDGEVSETSPDTTKLWVLYLQKNGATSNNYTDAWKEFLVIGGYDGIIPDDIDLYFGDNS